MLIIYGEMCREDQPVKGDAALLRKRHILCKFSDKCIFEYTQSLRNPAYEFQRMELRLFHEPDRPRRMDGKLAQICQKRLISKPRQCFCFFF